MAYLMSFFSIFLTEVCLNVPPWNNLKQVRGFWFLCHFCLHCYILDCTNRRQVVVCGVVLCTVQCTLLQVVVCGVVLCTVHYSVHYCRWWCVVWFYAGGGVVTCTVKHCRWQWGPVYCTAGIEVVFCPILHSACVGVVLCNVKHCMCWCGLVHCKALYVGGGVLCTVKHCRWWCGPVYPYQDRYIWLNITLCLRELPKTKGYI